MFNYDEGYDIILISIYSGKSDAGAMVMFVQRYGTVVLQRPSWSRLQKRCSAVATRSWRRPLIRTQHTFIMHPFTSIEFRVNQRKHVGVVSPSP